MRPSAAPNGRRRDSQSAHLNAAMLGNAGLIILYQEPGQPEWQRQLLLGMGLHGADCGSASNLRTNSKNSFGSCRSDQSGVETCGEDRRSRPYLECTAPRPGDPRALRPTGRSTTALRSRAPVSVIWDRTTLLQSSLSSDCSRRRSTASLISWRTKIPRAAMRCLCSWLNVL